MYTTGDSDAGVWTAGMVVGLIHDIPTCKDMMATVVADAESIISKRLQGLVTPRSRL